MSSWDYMPTADGEDLHDYCDRAVVVTEGMANREDANFKIPGFEGEVSFPNKLWDAGNVILNTFIKYADANGEVTHADGMPGHVYENLSALKRIFGKNGMVDLRRIAPDYGETKMLVELIQGPSEGSFPAHQIWVLKAPKPFWAGLTPVVLSGSGTHTPEGDAPVDDMVVEFSADGKVQIDDEWIEIVGASGAITVDCGDRAGYPIVAAGSGDVPMDRYFTPYSDRWLRLYGGYESTVTFTGGASTLTYYPHWHGGG